jgi:rubrerythrin
VEEIEEIDEVDEDQGFKSYEQYIEEGGDPEFYRGKKAYLQQKKVIQEIKEMKAKTKQIDDFMFEQEKRHAKETERLLKQIESQKAEAKADLDFERYDALEQQRQDLQGVQTKVNQGEPIVIAQYRKTNPELDPQSLKFDPVHNAAFSAAFNAIAMQTEQRLGRPVTDAEVQELLEETSKKLNPKPAPRASKVASSTNSGGKKTTGLDKLSPEQKALYSKWLKDPKKKAYAEQLIKNAE